MSREESIDEALRGIEAELARQDEAWKEVESILTSLGDVQLAIPQTFLDEIEELARPRVQFDNNNNNNAVPFGIRA
jgi:hypothetical protein